MVLTDVHDDLENILFDSVPEDFNGGEGGW